MKKSRRILVLSIGGSLAILFLTCFGLWLLVGSHVVREYENNWKGSGSFDDPVAVEQTKQIGNRIIDALEQYNAQHGSYPGRLADLVPAFMIQIPKPTAGYGEWDYGVYDGGFALAFGVGRHTYPCHFRTHDRDDWYHDN